MSGFALSAVSNFCRCAAAVAVAGSSVSVHCSSVLADQVSNAITGSSGRSFSGTVCHSRAQCVILGHDTCFVSLVQLWKVAVMASSFDVTDFGSVSALVLCIKH